MWRRVILSVLVFITFPSPSHAQRAGGEGAAAFLNSGTTFWGVKGGFWGGATVYVANGASTSAWGDGGISLGGFVDYALSPKLTGGLLADWTDFDGDPVYDFSIALKALVGGEDRTIGFRPTIAFGYASFAESYGNLTLRGGVEAVKPTGRGSAWVAELLLYGSPTGGDEDYWVTWGPGVLLRAGYIF